MAQNIEIPVSLGLQAAEGQVNHLRKILSEAVKIDSTAFRGLSQALQKAENDVARLKSQMNSAFQSTAGSKKFLADYDKLFESLATIGNRFGFLKESEMIFSPENAEVIKNARAEMAQLSDEIQQIKSGKVGKLFEDDSVASIKEVREVANDLGVTLSKTTFQDFSQKISGAMTNAKKDLDDTRKQIELLKEAAKSADLKKDSIFSQLNIDKLMGNTAEVIDKNGAKTLRGQIAKLYEEYGLTDVELGKNIKAGSNIDQIFIAEEERVKASSEKYIEILQEQKNKIQEEIDKFDEGLKQSGGEGKRANWKTKLTYIDEIKQKFAGLLTFSDVPVSVSKDGTGITKYIESFKQELINGMKNLSTDDITRVLQEKVQVIFSNASTKSVITDLGSFKQQITVMMKEAFGDLNLGDVTNGIGAGWDFDKAIEMVVANIKTALQNLDPKELEGKAAQYEATLKKLESASKTVSDTERASTGSLKEKEVAFQALAEEVTKYVAAQLGITTEQVQAVLRGDADAANQGRVALEGYIQSLNKLTQKQQALGNIQSAVNRWMGFWQVLNMTKSAINDMKQHIQELDTVMTSISVVTNFSQEDLWGQISQYSEIARQYGVAIKGVYEVSQIYYQQGLQQNDVMTLTTETLKMARIAGLDYATAADYMTTAIRGFKLEMTDAVHVTDVFSALAATTASSTEEIAVAISKTAASAEAVGASFEATSAMMATMIATTRESATNIGTALKSVISRYGEMTGDPSKTVDSEGEEMSLNRVDKALQTVGITIHDTAGQFRDFDDVMLELMEKWGSLDSLSQRYIATLMAGNRQQSRFLALVSNVDEYKKALQTAMDSEGTGELQTLKTLDSIDAKIEKMKVTIQEFYTSSGLEELYKNVLDGITNIVSAANSLPKTFGKIPVQALAVGMSIVNVIKSVITLIISEIQAGLQQIQGKAANTFEGLIIQATAQGEEIGKAVKTGIERGAEGAGSTIGSQLKGMILRNVGAIASLAGSALTLKGFNEYGASTSEKTDQLAGIKTFSGGILGVAGSAISGVATGAMMGSAAGPGGIAVGAVLGGIKGLISNFATLASGIDMMNISLARQIELSKKRVENAQEEELRAKNSEKNLSQAAEKLKELEQHRYDSIESEKEYYDYMAQLADSYPEYINSINEAGNAIIHSTDLEVALASAREITAQKTLAATEAELEQSKLQLDAYKNFNSNLATLGETSDILEIGFQAAKKYGTGNQVYERLFTAYNMAHPESTIDIGTANTWQAENKAQNLWTADPQIREQILTWAREEGFTRSTNDNDKKNDFIRALDDIISESDSELSYKQLTGGLAENAEEIRKLNSEQLQQAISRATNMAQNYIDSQTTAIDNITKLYTQEQFDQKVLTSLSKETEANKTILDQYKNLLSFGLNAQFTDVDIKDIPADQWEQAFSDLSRWIINNQDAALALMNIDYSQYVDAEEIKKSIPNYEGLDENIRAAIEKNLDDTRTTAITLYENQIKSIFGESPIEDWLESEHFTARTLTAIQSDLRQYQTLIDKQQYAQAEAYLNSMKAIYGPEGIGGLSGENQTKAYSIIKDLDLSDPEALRSAAETFAEMGSEFSGVSNQFTNAALRWATNAATLLEQLSSSTQETAKSIESSTSDMSKVFKYSEALEKAQAIMDANEGVKFNELFTYDKDLGGYVKTAKAFQLEMAELQNQQVEGISLAITDITKTLSSVFDNKDFINLANSGRTIETDQVKETFARLTHTKEGDVNFDRLWLEYTQIIEAFRNQDEDWNIFITKYINEHGTQLQLQLDEINNMSSQMASLQLESFDYTSIVSGKGTIQSKETLKALLNAALPEGRQLVDEIFDKYYNLLVQGKVDEFNKYIKQINSEEGTNIKKVTEGEANRARFESLTSLYEKIASGDVVWDALTEQEQELLNSVEGVNLTEDASATQIGAAADNVWTAIIKLIQAGAGTLNEVANSLQERAKKDYLATDAGKQYDLLSKLSDGFTADEITSFTDEQGKHIFTDEQGNLDSKFNEYFEFKNNKWMIAAGQDAAAVIEYLAEKLGISIDDATEEYKKIISDSIDEEIKKADEADTGKQRVEKLSKIMSGKVTDRISLAGYDDIDKAYLEAAGLITDSSANFVYIQSEEQLNNAIKYFDSLLSNETWTQNNSQTARYFQQLVSDFEAKTAKNAAFEGIVGEQFNQSAAEALSMALQNTTEYSKVQSLMTEMGFKWDQAAQVWKATAESIEAIRSKIRQSFSTGEIDNETYLNLIASLNETAEAISPKTKQDNALLDMLQNYNNVSEAMRAAFINNFYQYGIKASDFLTKNDNGTYDVNVGALKSFLDSIGFEYDKAARSEIETITDSYLSNIQTASAYSAQGASSLADIETFRQSYADIVHESLDTDAFQYDSLTQSFILDPAIMHKYIDAQKEILTGMGYTEEFVNAYITDQTDKAIQAGIELDSFLNANTSKQRNDEANKLIQQIRGLSNYRDIAILASNLTDAIEITKEEYDLAILRVLESGGKDAVDLLKEIKPDASSEDLEAVFNSQINKLNDVIGQVGDLVAGQFVGTEGKLYEILKRAKAVDDNGVVKPGLKMVEVYAAIYDEMTNTIGKTTASLNDVYAQMWNATFADNNNIKELMSSAGGMTMDAFKDILSQYEVEIKNVMDNNTGWGINWDAFGNIIINDIDKFMEGLQSSGKGFVAPQKDSYEYQELRRSWADAMVEIQNRPLEIIDQITNEITQLSQAKNGQSFNISTLQHALNKSDNEISALLADYAVDIENGILTIRDASDIPGIMHTLAQEASEANVILTEDLQEIADAVSNLLQEIANIISNGISGKLSNVEAGKLTNWASERGIDVDYTRTAEGLQLTAESAAQVYEEMKKIDPLLAKSLLPEIKDTKESYSTLTGTLMEFNDYNQQVAHKQDLANLKALEHNLNEESEQAWRKSNSKVKELYEKAQQAASLGGGQVAISQSNRPKVISPEGGIMTYNSLSSGVKGGKEILVTPILPDGTVMSDNWAEEYASKMSAGKIELETKLVDENGKELDYKFKDIFMGAFDDVEAADKAAEAYHEYGAAVFEAAGAIDELTAKQKAMKNTLVDLISDHMLDPDSMNFMSNKLPDYWQGPVNMWENASQAMTALTEGGKKGYMGVQEFYNIVTTASSLIEAAGKEFEIAGMNASELLQKGAENIKVVGGKAQIDLSGAGITVAGGVDQLKSNMADGVHELARAQIAILDAEIAVLEILAAMEKVGDLDVDMDGISFELEDIFADANDPFSEFAGDMTTWLGNLKAAIDASEGAKELLQNFKVNGKDMYSLLSGGAEEWRKAFGSNENIQKVLKQFTNTDWDVTGDLQSQVMDFLKNLDLGDFDTTFTYETPEMTIEFTPGGVKTIDWTTEDTQTVLNQIKEAFSGDEATARKAIQDDIKAFSSGQTMETLTIEQVAQINGKIKTVEGNTVFVDSDGNEIDSTNSEKYAQALAKFAFEQNGIDSTNAKVDGDFLTTNVTVGTNTNVKVKTKIGDKKGGIVWEYESADGIKGWGNTEAEMLDNYWKSYVDKFTGGEQNATKAMLSNEAEKQRVLYLEFGIRAAIKASITGKDGKVLDPSTDPGLRQQMRDIADTISGEDAQKLIKDGIVKNLGNGNLEVPIGKDGVKITIPGEAIDLDAEGNYDTAKLAEYIKTATGLDTVMAETISAGITDAFSKLPEIIGKVLDTIDKADTKNLESTITNIKNLTSALSNLIKLTPDEFAAKLGLLTEELNTLTESSTLTTDALLALIEAITAVDEALAALTGEDKKLDINTSALEGKLAKLKQELEELNNQKNKNTKNGDEGGGSGGKNSVPKQSSIFDKNGKISSEAVVRNVKAEITSAKASPNMAPVETTVKVGNFEVPVNTTPAQIPVKADKVDVSGAEGTVIEATIEPNTEGIPETIETTQIITPVGQLEDVDDFETTQIIKQDGAAVSGPASFTTIQYIKTQRLGGGGGGGCFVAGTQISMANGTTKNIEDVVVGDLVVAYNYQYNQFVTGRINKAYVHHNTPKLMRVSFSDGRVITLTPGHPLLSTKGWKSRDLANSLYEHKTIATWLEIGDVIIGLNGTSVVINIEDIEVPENYDTYNAEVETYHTFIANGLVAHNAKVAISPEATGNVGLAKSKGTLMGELGPELVVSNGRYFIAGQNGAEMVDLADDAIVFNHLQTDQLLKKGMSNSRGKAVTSEKNAVAFATGNTGPAMASASAALAQLKKLRAMWEGLLNASVSDLAGAGGGGGGGGGSSNKANIVEPGAWIDTVERWYDLTQKIAKLEKEITYQEQIRSKISSDWQKDGAAYFRSQEKSLTALREQIRAQEQLNISRQTYFNERVAALKDEAISRIYTIDNEGQLKFTTDEVINGKKGGMEFLTDLYGFNNLGKANYTNKEKYDILQRNGFGAYMKYDSNGQEIKPEADDDGTISEENWESFYESATEAFRDRLDSISEATQSLWDSIQEGNEELEKLETDRNGILEEIRENQMDVEQSVLDAIISTRQRAIDEMQETRDALQDSTDKYIEGLNDALQKERQMYETQESQAELTRKQRQLGILQRSGGSASEIKALADDIKNSERDLYFELQQQQIDQLQETADLQIERMDTQINLMTELLEFEKTYGLLWDDVYAVMSGSADQIATFCMGNNADFWAQSPLATEKTFNDLLFGSENWTTYRDEIEANGGSFATGIANVDTSTQAVETQAETIANILATEDRRQQMDREYTDYDKAMKAEYGQDYDKSGKYKKLFETEYMNGRSLTEATEVARKQYYTDVVAPAEAARRAAEEEAARRAAAAAAIPAPAPASSGGGGGNSETKCADCAVNCGGACYNACQNGCAQVCRGSTNKLVSSNLGNQTCEGNCTGTAKGHVGNFKSTTNKGSAYSSGKDDNKTASRKKYVKTAAGGYVNHGYYELGERGTETVLTASQTQVLRNNILSDRPSSLISLLKTYNEGFSRMNNATSALSESVQDNSVTIEKVDLNMNVQQLSNDYDAKRAGDQVLSEILRVAKKTSAANSVRR